MAKETRLPSSDEINALVSYLPRLYAPSYNPEPSWDGGWKDEKGNFHMHHPIYDDLVEEFIRAASSEYWLDYGYNPEEAYSMLKNDEVIKSATLAQVKIMLTFVIRGERFSEGHWGEMIKRGYVRKLLERLAQLGR